MSYAKVVTIVSGGLDSVTLAYYMRKRDYAQHLLTFNYGQRHSKEIDCAVECARDLGVSHSIIDVRSLGAALKGSALTDFGVPVPHGHYAQENMAITVVPNRNAIMLSMAWGVAIAEKADFVAYAAHSGDHAIYPDCRPEFVGELSTALRTGTETTIGILAPFLPMTKAEIVKTGREVGTPFAHTWSCYEGGFKACGKCGTCVERLEAFALAGIDDPIQYADREYWKKAVDYYNAEKAVERG